MKLQFKCTLLSDIIINQKASTSGHQETLDFIPGSNFLGITAAALYNEEKLSKKEQVMLFHSGQIKFGDAHPSHNGQRALRVPASFYYPKLESITDRCFIHHYFTKNQDKEDLQLKQCRDKFYLFANGVAKEIKTDKTFAIKSAYDRINRKSKDEQLYGYQSIDNGAIYYFEIDLDDAAAYLADKIKEAIIGKKHIGRSRTAQYGLVNIELTNYKETQSNRTSSKEGMLCIYADSRLIFINEATGLPTFQPALKDFGLTNGEIQWELSQIRTFQYAPWNYKRQSRDMDRCGLEKGSVIVIKTDDSPTTIPEYVGYFKNEGFGRIIVNPDFLQAKPNSNGLAVYQLKKEETPLVKAQPGKEEQLSTYDKLLLNYLVDKQKEENNKNAIYKSVEEFVSHAHNTKIFTQEVFASQWGNIRNLAIQYPDKNQLMNELFNKTALKNGVKIPFAYLTHGVAKEKWDERNRRRLLEDFISKTAPESVQFAVINLASEMAKKCSK